MTWNIVWEILVMVWGTVAGVAALLGIALLFFIWLDGKVD